MRLGHEVGAALAAMLVYGLCAAPGAGAAENGATQYRRFQADATVAYGIVEGGQVRELPSDLFGAWAKTDRTHALSEVKQQQNTSDMTHGVAETVSWISQHVTLEPGDLIFTGTMGTTTAMKPGDVVEVVLEGAGMLVNTVAAAP